MPINQVLLSNTFNEFRTTVNEIGNTVNDYASGTGTINAASITSGTLNSNRLANTTVTPGGYGSASLIPVIVIDEKGRITSAANVSVAGVSDFQYYSGNSNFVIFTADGGSYSTSIGQDLGTTANVTFNKVTVSSVPVSSTDLTNKQYVDTLVTSGIHFHAPVRVESPTNLTATYNNGTDGVGATLTNSGTQTALVIDGVTVNVNDRVLVYQQTDQKQNGIYVVTNVGSGSTNWVLTRATDADSYELASANGLSEGSSVFVQEGTTGAGELYTCNTSGTITFGTTNITFAQINSSQIYSAGTGLALNGTQFSLANTTVTAGSYGSANQIPAFTVDDQGRITTVSNVAVSGGINYVYKTSNYTAQDKEGVLANTAGGAFAVTLPTSPTVGMQVFIADSGDNWATNNLTVNRNASTIEGLSENLILDVAGASVQLVYDGFTWNVYSQVGGVGAFSNASYLTSGTLSNERTTAASANGSATIVLRDAAGNFSANVVTANVSGNLVNARLINGISFNASSDIIVEPYVENDESTNATRYLVFVDSTTEGYQRLNEDSALTYNPSTNLLTAGSISANGLNLVFLNGSNIGTGTVPAARLASGTANTLTFLRGDSTWQVISAGITLSNNTTSDSNAFYPVLAGAVSGAITTASVSGSKLFFNPFTGQLNSTQFNSLSDLNYKTNLVKIENSVNTIKELNGFEFDWIDTNKKSSGVIAQEVEKVLPHLVDMQNEQKSINYSGLIAYLIEAIKELSDRIEKIENKQNDIQN